MYKPRLKGSHEEMGTHYGDLLYKNGVRLDSIMPSNKKHLQFGAKSLNLCASIYPEIVDEIRAMANAMKIDFVTFGTFIITLGAFSRDIGCTVFSYRKDNKVYFCRNHDMFSNLKKTTESALIRPDNGYYFIGHGDGFIGKEDGVNEHGLAVGINFVAPKTVKPGLNFFLLVRMILEKCKNVAETASLLSTVPVCTSHNITVADREGNMAVFEMAPERTVVRYPADDEDFIISTNQFKHSDMAIFDNKPESDWYSTQTRYDVVHKALINDQNIDSDYLKNVLAGKMGMMCQYKRGLGFETLWSVIYELTTLSIEYTDGSPSRKAYKTDNRLDWAINKK
ncbi:C45 family peptidase [Reinekea sp. G2M2-21]|uniref:C45 family autoproteolytic acyltransferase/hydolase n=1 Tax=Reinekea sp. G2M2-21 TaxID=2788942 RepID=UPI0018AC4AF6|nr:C45 family peptidase [Reinekea sp. G2M2-21]